MADLTKVAILAEAWEREAARWANHHTQRQRAVSAVNRDHAAALRRALSEDAAPAGEADDDGYPKSDRAYRWGCGPCRWDPGPWHQDGCPSWRRSAPARLTFTGEPRNDWPGPSAPAPRGEQPAPAAPPRADPEGKS